MVAAVETAGVANMVSFNYRRVPAITLFKRIGDRQSAADCLLRQARHRPGSEDTLIDQALQLSMQINWTDGVDRAIRMGVAE